MLVFIFLSNFLMRDIYKFIGKGLPFKIIIEAILLNLAWIVTLAVPMSVLVSCIMAFGSLSQDNEITALKASGISTFKMTFSVIIVSIIIGFFTYEFNDKILTEFNYRARILMSDIQRKRPTIALEENIFFDIIPNYRFLIKKIERNSPWVYNILIFDQTDPNVQKSIIAEKGTFIPSKERNKLSITLYNGEIHNLQLQNLENYQRLKFEKYVITIDVPGYELERSSSQYRGDREKSIKVMKDDIKNLKNEINQQKLKINKLLGIPEKIKLKSITAIIDSIQNELNLNTKLLKESLFKDSNFQTNVNRLSILISRLKMEEAVLESKFTYKSSLEIEIHKKYSLSAACIVFVLIGVPLGVMTQKGGFAVGGGLSFLLFTIYWAFLIGGESLGDRGIISPFWAMWTPNILIGCTGIYLLIKISKETPVLSFAFLKRLIPFKKFFLK